MRAQLLILAAVGCSENYRSLELAISSPPPMRTGVATHLAVPARCPIYTPNGGDIDTPEPPWEAPFRLGCGVDETGDTYGLVTGDTGDLAVLPGDRELGVYLGFDPGSMSTELDPEQTILAWAAAVNVENYPCCAEDDPAARTPIRVVALGPTGILVSLGHVGTNPLQWNIDWQTHVLFPANQLWYGLNDRFYVNRAP